MKKYLAISLMILAFAAVLTAQTRNDGTYYSIYGQQFLNGVQSLRLVVDNPRYSDSEIIPCVRVTMILSFFDLPIDGSTRLRPLRRVTRGFELDPGEAASFDIPAALACDGSVCPQARNGVYVNVSVFATPVEGEPLPPGRVKFNSTLSMREFGRTIFTLPAAEKGFDPQPDPPQE